ncbi:MAG: hypothetical protein ACKPDI_06955, partial [Actinomycetota bacterium]
YNRTSRTPKYKKWAQRFGSKSSDAASANDSRNGSEKGGSPSVSVRRRRTDDAEAPIPSRLAEFDDMTGEHARDDTSTIVIDENQLVIDDFLDDDGERDDRG